MLDDTSVLVVDDDAESREFLVYLLRQLGAHVASASSAEIASDVPWGRVDAILLRPAPPDETGLDALRSLRRSVGFDVPAIVLTGSFHYARRIAGAGVANTFDAHLTLPFHPVDLDHLIRVVLDPDGRRLARSTFPKLLSLNGSAR